MKTPINLQTGSQIREFRKKRGITTKELAKLMDCSTSYIRQVESGHKKMSLEKLNEFAFYLSCRIEINFI